MVSCKLQNSLSGSLESSPFVLFLKWDNLKRVHANRLFDKRSLTIMAIKNFVNYS